MLMCQCLCMNDVIFLCKCPFHSESMMSASFLVACYACSYNTCIFCKVKQMKLTNKLTAMTIMTFAVTVQISVGKG